MNALTDGILIAGAALGIFTYCHVNKTTVWQILFPTPKSAPRQEFIGGE